MFESAELGHCISDREYSVAEPKLREDLLQAQYELLEKKSFPVIIVIGGVDGAGKGETVNILNKWMDPRHINAITFRAAKEASIQIWIDDIVFYKRK